MIHKRQQRARHRPIRPLPVNDPRTEEIGRQRVRIVIQALQDLKKRREICDFVETSRGDRSDRRQRDLYITVVRNGRRVWIPLQVTGPDWVASHYKKNKKVPIVSVDLRVPHRKLLDSISRYLIQIAKHFPYETVH